MKGKAGSGLPHWLLPFSSLITCSRLDTQAPAATALDLHLTTVISLGASDELFPLPPDSSPPKYPPGSVLPSYHLPQEAFPVLST